MAEYCNKCWNEINGERLFEGELKLTKNAEKCIKCGKEEPLVIRKYSSFERAILFPYLVLSNYIEDIRLRRTYGKFFKKMRKNMEKRLCFNCWCKWYGINFGLHHLKYTKNLDVCEECGMEVPLVINRKKRFFCRMQDTFGNFFREINYMYCKWWLKNFDRKHNKQ